MYLFLLSYQKIFIVLLLIILTDIFKRLTFININEKSSIYDTAM